MGTMRFSITDQFDCSPQRFREIVDSEEFERRFREETETRRVDVDEDADGESEYREQRFVSMRDIPAMMKKTLGVDRLEYSRKERYDVDDETIEWTVTTPFMTDRVEAGGTTVLEADDDGCLRTVEGFVAIDLPLVGSKMAEKFGGRLRDAEVATARIVRELLE